MRLIDADKVILEIVHKYGREQGDAILEIDAAPTVDAVPMRHGKWIYSGIRGRFPACVCSECGNVENADWAILGDNVNYCPNCGARMDGEEK